MQSNKGIVCLSLFDGISCGRVALERANIPVEKYYASEVDKYAIQVSEKNYPDIIHIGDVRNINPDDYKDVDMIIGGSPCQCFSFAGRRNGMTTTENVKVTSLEQYMSLKQKYFQFKGQSYLFWEYVRILSAVHPKYFLLENVVMAQEWNDIISRTLGGIYPECFRQKEMFESVRLEPIQINSALVSAQNRERLYWTNIPNITQPKDRHIMLKDVLEENVNYKYILTKKEFNNIKNWKSQQNPIIDAKTVDDEKMGCLTARGAGEMHAGMKLIKYSVDREKSLTLTATYANVIEKDYTINKNRQLVKCGAIDYQYWRKLTPIECERLQTLPNNYTDGISNSQRYRCIGNGWTVDVIAHIFSFI